MRRLDEQLNSQVNWGDQAMPAWFQNYIRALAYDLAKISDKLTAVEELYQMFVGKSTEGVGDVEAPSEN